ncbi:uncharacterized protein LOC129764782 [Toxorhynchites rutilus septentrionalis]|uniref:uncharacterized protein LOC129764782 n=1 Tax=Toxorhynchites rutilus septentrionalis TaxID=329112 RepID=UPI00247B1A8C|nr:uncharacterized protein LOC129764782 [Toxorhynchites rutilus septentrionalis]XP_055620235.1 uncharacterized protein LOC129764782 [Toxorhynchites rutilus septentrionalis]
MQDEDSRLSSSREKDRTERRRSRDRHNGRDRSRDRYRYGGDRGHDRRRDEDRRTDTRYRSDRSGGREDRYRDRHRDRSDRERDHRRRDRSESRDRRKRSRSKSRDRHVRNRSQERSDNSKERSRRNLSVEIEQELQNLRKLSDMKAASEKSQEINSRCSQIESESKAPEAESSSSFAEAKEPFKNDFAKIFSSTSSTKIEIPEIQTEEDRIEFQKKMQEKFQAHLAAEGRLYPKPKPSPAINSATGFANDGSFLEMFKKMQEQAQTNCMPAMGEECSAQYYATSSVPTHTQQPTQPVAIPCVGRRRGGKILKTGIVKKAKPIEESYVETPSDAWNLYLQEVKKYKNASCDEDSKTRPLIK